MAWGYNDVGQLGDGTTVNRDVATQVPGLTGIKKIFAGTSDTQEIQGAGFALGHVGYVVDLSCEDIGVVKTSAW